MYYNNIYEIHLAKKYLKKLFNKSDLSKKRFNKKYCLIKII